MTEFVIYLDNDSFSVPSNPPWERERRWRVALRLGGRAVLDLPSSLVGAGEAFAERAVHSWVAGGQQVQGRASMLRGRKHGDALLVELWTERRRAESEDIRIAREALEGALKQVEAEFRLSWKQTTIEQEFIELVVPRFLARALAANTKSPTGAIAAHCWGMKGSDRELKTVTIRGQRICVGPERKGLIDGVAAFVRTETGDRARDAALEPFHLFSATPLVTALVMLAAWWVPLSLQMVEWFALTLVALAGVTAYPALDVGWRAIFRRTYTIAACGFLAIGAFGIGYALCGLLDPGSIGDARSLGDAFLISTSLGIAGGLIGDGLTNAARVLAHVQLLLFLGGLVSAVAVLLRIDSSVRRRE